MKVSIQIDKSKSTRVLSTKQGEKKEHDRLYDFVTASSYGVPGSKHWKHKKHNWSYVSLPLEGKKLLIIGYGYANKKMRGTYDFNYPLLGPVGRAKLAEYIEPLIEGGLKTLLGEGTLLNRVEIAIDIDGASYEDYLFIDTRLSSFSSFYDAVGTLYLGAQASARRFCIYNKKKQLKTKGIEVSEARLRIEAILNRPLISFPALPNVANPFAHLMVIRRDAVIAAAASNPALKHFAEQIKSGKNTPQFVFKMTPKKKLLRASLESLQESWWNPEQIWDGMSEAVSWTKG